VAWLLRASIVQGWTGRASANRSDFGSRAYSSAKWCSTVGCGCGVLPRLAVRFRAVTTDAAECLAGYLKNQLWRAAALTVSGV